MELYRQNPTPPDAPESKTIECPICNDEINEVNAFRYDCCSKDCVTELERLECDGLNPDGSSLCCSKPVEYGLCSFCKEHV